MSAEKDDSKMSNELISENVMIETTGSISTRPTEGVEHLTAAVAHHCSSERPTPNNNGNVLAQTINDGTPTRDRQV
jgi:hypothetical protein